MSLGENKTMRQRIIPFTSGQILWAILMGLSMLILSNILVARLGSIDILMLSRFGDVAVLLITCLCIFVIGMGVLIIPHEPSIQKLRARQKIIRDPAIDYRISFNRMSVEVGELIHGIGNDLVDGRAKIGSLSIEDGRILQELGHALRVSLVCGLPPSHLFPVLNSVGFYPEQDEKAFITAVASRFIGNNGLLTFNDCVQQEREIQL